MSKIDFNTKHLKKGDPLPPYNGKLRVYSMRYCPYAQRVILALNAKQLDFEVVNINHVEKPEWLPSKSAFGKVPAIEIADGVNIYESLIAVEYLDEVYPQRPLLSKDPVRKAFDKIIVEAFGEVGSQFYRALRNPDSITPDDMASSEKALDFIQEQLKKRGTPYFGGSEPGYVDYMNWPFFERISHLDGINEHVKIDPIKYKLLREYIEKMFKDPAVSQYVIPKDILLKYFESFYKKTTPFDYDLLLGK